MPSRTIENYLKQLYLEEQSACADAAPIPMGRLASLMNVVPGTATTMVKTLADSGLVAYSPRTGVRLSPQGTSLALHVLRRHRLVELFLVRIVGLDWAEVHAEAEELEHVISDKLLERMDALLGHPTVDPHGDPIPSSAGQIAANGRESFVDCPLGRPVEITRILDQEPAFLQFAVQSGLTPGSHFAIKSRDPRAGSIVVIRHGEPPGELALSIEVAAKFLVREAG